MATTILLKKGSGDPSTSLNLAEPAFDVDASHFFLGAGVGKPSTKFYNSVYIDTEIARIDSSLGTGVDYTYIDGSLATRDAEISQLDASVIRIDADITQLEASIARIDASLGTSMDYTYVDGSLAARDAQISQLDASVVRIDASLQAIGSYTTFDYVDGSLSALESYVDSSLAARDASMWVRGLLFIDGAGDVAFASDRLTGKSGSTTYYSSDSFTVLESAGDGTYAVGGKFGGGPNGPLYLGVINTTTITIGAADVSTTLNGDLLVNGVLTGPTISAIDASIIRIDASLQAITPHLSKDYVDGSIASAVNAVDTSLVSYINPLIARLDASVVRLDAYQIIQDTSITLKADITYVDASLVSRDASISYNLDEVNQLDASIQRIDASLWVKNPIYNFVSSDTLLVDPTGTNIERIYKNISAGDVSIYSDGTFQIDGVNEWILPSMSTMQLYDYDVSNYYII